MPTPQWTEPTLGLERKWGFDGGATPPWFLVGVRRPKPLRLDFGSGMIVRPVNRHIVTLSEDGSDPVSRFFNIEGRSPGHTRIEVIDPKLHAVVAVLAVAVKGNNRPLRISFHFIEDRAGDKTVRQPDIVDALIADLNSIYTSQTNLTFEAWSVEEKRVEVDLGDVVVNETDKKSKQLTGGALIMGKGLWKDIFLKKGNRQADFNVFFVPTEDPINTNRNDIAFVDGTNCVIEDGFVGLDKILPHTVGRMLGCPVTFDLNEIQFLMFWNDTIFRSDNFIPKACAEIMNP